MNIISPKVFNTFGDTPYLIRIMVNEIKVIKRFKPFIMGKCRCGCNEDIPIRTGCYLRKFQFGHDMRKRGHIKRNNNEYIKCQCGNCDKIIKRFSEGEKIYERKYHLGHRPQRGGYKTKQGYKEVVKKGHQNSWSSGHILNHRLIMSNYLRRPLERWEHVHHIIPIKEGGTDDISNLMIITKSEHTSLHNKIKQCKIDNERRKCHNPDCKTPYETYIKKNGRPDWRRKDNLWYCKKCSTKK